MGGDVDEFKKQRYNQFYMDIAERVAQMSFAKRLKVGSVLVKGNNILSYGWNGMPVGWDNNCEDKNYMSIDTEDLLSPEEIEGKYPYTEYHHGHQRQVRYRLITKPETLHSEANCLMKVARSAESSEGATLYCTHAPCIECSKLIYQSGVKNLYYRTQYRSTAGLEFLAACSVPTIQI